MSLYLDNAGLEGATRKDYAAACADTENLCFSK